MYLHKWFSNLCNFYYYSFFFKLHFKNSYFICLKMYDDKYLLARKKEKEKRFLSLLKIMVVMTCCLYILITKSLFRLASSQTTPFQHLFRQMKKNFAAASRILPLLAILVVPSYFRDDGTELLFAHFFPFFFHSSYSVRFACCCCEDNVIFMIINLCFLFHIVLQLLVQTSPCETCIFLSSIYFLYDVHPLVHSTIQIRIQFVSI